MSTLEVLLIALVCFIIVYALVLRRSPKNLPPGPRSLPIVGNLFDFPGSKHVYKDFLEYREKYGDVVRLSFGPSRDFILVFGHKAIHKGLIEQGNDFKFRPTNLYLINKLFHGKGVLFGNGEIHQKLRKFTLDTLKTFGLGKKVLEERIQDEARILADELKSYGGQPRDIRKTLKKAVSNIIAGIVYGSSLDPILPLPHALTDQVLYCYVLLITPSKLQRLGSANGIIRRQIWVSAVWSWIRLIRENNGFDYGDPDFLLLIKNIETIFTTIAGHLPENFWPFLAFLPSSKTRQVLDAAGDMAKYARKRIKEHRETFNPKNIRDFVDLYLKAEEQGNEEVVNEENMFRDIIDLSIAGTESTATALAWAILYLMNNPDVQEKCQKEIIQNVGSRRAVSLSDKEKLQYLDATIKETLRLASIVPLGVPHTVLKDTQFEGYTIPKDSTVIFHVNSVLTDPNIWKNPDKFQPERFLTEEGKKKKKELFVPFSLGLRSCPGKPLATTELFLYLGNLLQQFTFKIPPGCPTPSVERVHTGLTCQPHPYQVCAVPN